MFPRLNVGTHIFAARLGLASSLVLALLFLFVGAAHADPAAPGSIAGTVRNTDGAPLAGIDVLVAPVDGPLAAATRFEVTDSNGNYRAPVLPAGAYRVRFEDPARVYARQYYPDAAAAQGATDIVVAGNDVTGVDTVLVRAGGIAGLVAGTDGQPQYGSIVVYANTGSTWSSAAYTYTENSTYQVDQLRPGVYHVCTEANIAPPPPDLTITPDGFTYARYQSCYERTSGGVAHATDVTVEAGKITGGIDLRPGEETDFATVGGTVTDEAGNPLPDVVVEVNPMANSDFIGRREKTDAQGVYTVTKIPAGNGLVRFIDPMGLRVSEYYSDALRVESAVALQLAPGEARHGIDAALASGGRISGAVTLGGEVVPPTVYVQALAAVDGVYPPSNVTTVRASTKTGTYMLGGLRPGVYRVAISAYDYPDVFTTRYYVSPNVVTTTFAAAANFTVTAGSTFAPIDFDLAIGQYDGSISGVVTGDNSPLQGVRVELYRSEYYISQNRPLVYTFSDTAGAYRFDGLQSGVYYVRFIDLTGFYGAMYYVQSAGPSAATWVGVSSGKVTTGIDAQLRHAGSLSGAVRQSDGSPLVDAPVRLYANFAGYWFFNYLREVRTDAQGFYRFTGLLPSTYDVCAQGLQGLRCFGGLMSANNIESVPVAVVADKETRDVDISFATPTPLYLPIIGRR